MATRIIVVLILVFLTTSLAAANELYFPKDDWETVKPAAAGWNPDKLSTAIDFAMSRKSSGIVILYRGRIMAERHQDLQPKSARCCVRGARPEVLRRAVLGSCRDTTWRYSRCDRKTKIRQRVLAPSDRSRAKVKVDIHRSDQANGP